VGNDTPCNGCATCHRLGSAPRRVCFCAGSCTLGASTPGEGARATSKPLQFEMQALDPVCRRCSPVAHRYEGSFAAEKLGETRRRMCLGKHFATVGRISASQQPGSRFLAVRRLKAVPANRHADAQPDECRRAQHDEHAGASDGTFASCEKARSAIGPSSRAPRVSDGMGCASASRATEPGKRGGAMRRRPWT
jgi:hypothetical protein